MWKRSQPFLRFFVSPIKKHRGSNAEVIRKTPEKPIAQISTFKFGIFFLAEGCLNYERIVLSPKHTKAR